MELAAIGSGTCSPGIADLLTRRVASEQWAMVYADNGGSHIARVLAEVLDVSVTVADPLDLEAVIDRHAGQRVLAVCEPWVIRTLAATVLDVDPDGVPLPRCASLTRFRASRNGTRNLICLNDALHLPDSQRVALAPLEMERH
jgi:hypothetical protein